MLSLLTLADAAITIPVPRPRRAPDDRHLARVAFDLLVSLTVNVVARNLAGRITSRNDHPTTDHQPLAAVDPADKSRPSTLPAPMEHESSDLTLTARSGGAAQTAGTGRDTPATTLTDERSKLAAAQPFGGLDVQQSIEEIACADPQTTMT